MLLRAAIAVSTSPPMPGYRRYAAAINSAARSPIVQPEWGPLRDALRDRARRWPDLRGPPRRIRRLASALISFVDDYESELPAEAFDDRAVRSLLDAVLASPRPQTIPDLFDRIDADSFLHAALIVHAALRQAARGRDGRALPSCQMSMDQRLRTSERIAPFPEAVSRGGDPLGDAYHYAANLCVGIVASIHRPQTLPLVPLFATGPELMWLVREKSFGSELFFGNHARLDRMGLLHGLALGRLR